MCTVSTTHQTTCAGAAFYISIFICIHATPVFECTCHRNMEVTHVKCSRSEPQDAAFISHLFSRLEPITPHADSHGAFGSLCGVLIRRRHSLHLNRRHRYSSSVLAPVQTRDLIARIGEGGRESGLSEGKNPIPLSLRFICICRASSRQVNSLLSPSSPPHAAPL